MENSTHVITLKDLEERMIGIRTIVSFHQENKWIVVELDNGMKIKFRNW